MKIFETHMLDKVLVSKICREYLQLNNETITLIKMGTIFEHTFHKRRHIST